MAWSRCRVLATADHRSRDGDRLRGSGHRRVAFAGFLLGAGAYLSFLRVGDDSRTVHYFLSVPKGDVGETTGWTAGSEGTNRLHLTAVGQMLAFTLQALKTPPRSQRWRTEAAAQLRSWEVVYDELLDAIPEGTTQSSEYQPPENDSFLRMSPVQLRGRGAKHSSPSCWQAEKRREASDARRRRPGSHQ